MRIKDLLQFNFYSISSFSFKGKLTLPRQILIFTVTLYVALFKINTLVDIFLEEYIKSDWKINNLNTITFNDTIKSVKSFKEESKSISYLQILRLRQAPQKFLTPYEDRNIALEFPGNTLVVPFQLPLPLPVFKIDLHKRRRSGRININERNELESCNEKSFHFFFWTRRERTSLT